MKTRTNLISAVLLIGFAFTGIQCKKEDKTTPCKTCTAISGGADGGSIQKQVCSPAEESDFRNQNAGREISCN